MLNFKLSFAKSPFIYYTRIYSTVPQIISVFRDSCLFWDLNSIVKFYKIFCKGSWTRCFETRCFGTRCFETRCFETPPTTRPLFGFQLSLEQPQHNSLWIYYRNMRSAQSLLYVDNQIPLLPLHTIENIIQSIFRATSN